MRQQQQQQQKKVVIYTSRLGSFINGGVAGEPIVPHSFSRQDCLNSSQSVPEGL